MKKLLLSVISFTVLASGSAFAINQGGYIEGGVGAAAFSAESKNVNVTSDSVLHLKGGLGYRAHFSKTTPLFFGVDGHINNYDKSATSADAGVMLGGDLSKYLGVYIKVGGEYYFDGGDLRPRAALGINYNISQCLTLNVESAATSLVSTDDADVFLTSVSGGLQFNF